MSEVLARFLEDVGGRIGGPLTFRHEGWKAVACVPYLLLRGLANRIARSAHGML